MGDPLLTEYLADDIVYGGPTQEQKRNGAASWACCCGVRARWVAFLNVFIMHIWRLPQPLAPGMIFRAGARSSSLRGRAREVKFSRYPGARLGPVDCPLGRTKRIHMPRRRRK